MSEKTYTTDLAGHCNEPTAWKILKETSGQMMERQQLIVNPSLIAIEDNGSFTLQPDTLQQSGFDAPETSHSDRTTASAVWSMGATLFYIVMGRQVMNDKGGQSQTATSKLPYMRIDWPELSDLVQQCLQYAPAKRPSLQQIHDKAVAQCTRCENDIKRGPKIKAVASPQHFDNTELELDFWPETMQPINQTKKSTNP